MARRPEYGQFVPCAASETKLISLTIFLRSCPSEAAQCTGLYRDRELRYAESLNDSRIVGNARDFTPLTITTTQSSAQGRQHSQRKAVAEDLQDHRHD